MKEPCPARILTLPQRAYLRHNTPPRGAIHLRKGHIGTNPILIDSIHYYGWAGAGGSSMARMKEIRAGTAISATQVQSMTYQYSLVGNISQIGDGKGGETINFSYDELNRLTTVSGAYSASYTYAAGGASIMARWAIPTGMTLTIRMQCGACGTPGTTRSPTTPTAT